MEIKQLTFWEVLRLERERKGMSQEDLATFAGVSRSYVSMIERGFTDRVSMGILQSLCDVLGLEFVVSLDRRPPVTSLEQEGES
jgi:transcriptional regulator with XRE-family HTH domain